MRLAWFVAFGILVEDGVLRACAYVIMVDLSGGGAAEGANSGGASMATQSRCKRS